MISPSSQETQVAHSASVLPPAIADFELLRFHSSLYDTTLDWDEHSLYSTTTPSDHLTTSDKLPQSEGHGFAPWDSSLFDAQQDMYPHSGDYGGAVPLGKPRSVPQQPSFGDVQLFGDDEPPLFAAPLASSSTSPNFGAPNDLPLPDLIPDSPTDFSPPNTYSLPSFQHSSAYQQQQQRNERSSSVPVPSLPKPIRRRTQEFKDQQSFVPTLYGQPSNGLQNPFAPPPLPAFGVGNSGGSPSTDHPLSLPEQQDLLDRVRRDLHGVDLDNIKGPLRALALSSNPPRQPSSYGPNIELPPSPQHYPLGALHQLSQQQQREKDEMMRKTVSPQEAFLDYEDVDHRLHPSGAAGSPFGVGVSLFAPIPRAASQPTATRTPPPLSTSHSASPSRASSPGGVGLSTSPHNASHFGSARKPHPFAVPQNAVSWKDRRQASGDDVNGEDDEGSEEGDDDEDSPVVKQEDGIVGMSDLRNQRESSSDDEVDDGGVIGQFDEDTKPALPPSIATRPTHLLPPTTATTTSLFIPPAPAPTRTSPGPAATAHDHMRPSARRALDLLHHVNNRVPGLNGDEDADAEGDDEEDADAEGEVDDEVASLPSRSSARATSARAHTAEEEQDDEDYVPHASTSSITASGRPARSTAGQRKRTRSPFAEAPSDSEASDGESFHASGSDSDTAPGPRASSSSSAHRRTAPAPNKRRRRIPPSSSLHSTSSTAIRCPHVNTDGTTCGVVFRRPYDLARHRETIHGETAEGKATKKVEWTCKGCGGTFSRKDALIRHARIRGHKSGI